MTPAVRPEAATSDPVLVLGNGPVGQTTALLLARHGIPSILLDARDSRDAVGSKAICQQRDVLDIWGHVGAGHRIAAEGLTWSRARTMYRDDELFCVEFADRGHSPWPAFVNVSQTRTEEILDEQIAAQPLIDVRWGHRVVGLEPNAAEVVVEAETADGAVTLRAPYAVAATGARGDVVRRALGLSFEGRSFEDHFLICDIRADLPGWADERRFYFDPEWNPGRQVLIHPCPDSTFRIDWQVPATFDLAEEQRSGALDRRIRAIIGDRDYEVVWSSVYRFHSRCAERMRRGRVLLAGDVAHLVSPFGARGLNSGVMDAENAAWKLAWVLRGWADEALLDSYDAERRAAAAENLDVTSRTMEFLVPGSPEAAEHRRRTLEAALADPNARSAVDSGRLAEPFWYVDSPLSTPDPTRPPATRPERGALPTPGVGVLLPDFVLDDGPAPTLHALAREGILLLSHGSLDDAALAEARTAARGAPVAAHRMAELHPGVSTALGARTGETWVVRPDAHVAAVTTTSGATADAVARLLGRVSPASSPTG